ncbi:hypothetical protein MBLNU13_g08840t1 [Cladosporium sp. NU13]
MRDSLFKQLEEQGKTTDSVRSIISQKLDFTNDQFRALHRNITQIADAAQAQLSAFGDHQREASANLRRGQHDLNHNIHNQFSKLSIASNRQTFLDSLYFPEMFARQESMKKNLPGTYDWVFEGKLPLYDGDDHTEHQELQGRILHWLRETDGAPVFWISGKPASGKSSLISFIMNDKRTSKSLQIWTGGCVPYIFSFYFWKPGSTLQKSMTGLRRSLIWQLCKAKPSIIFQLLCRDSTLLYSPWTEAKSIAILRSALSAYRNDHLFFIIDGLDECEDNHSDLLDELQGLSLNLQTKVCISSRPEQPFSQRLNALPSIRLQDLNSRDIYKYAQTKLEKGDDRTTRLARDLAIKAEGVFLWAVLVCDSLCSGLMAKDDEQTLLQRLNAYPTGLDELFDRMFASMEMVHYKTLAFYFYAAQQPAFSVALAVASQSTQRIESLEHFGEMCVREVTRIEQQSRGLLQICTIVADDDHYNCAWSLKDVRTGSITPTPLNSAAFRRAKQHLHLHIRFVHRSAYDYILEATDPNHLTWLKSLHEDKIVRKVLAGALWLAEHGPILHVAAGQLRTTNRLSWLVRLTLPADEVLKVDQKWLYGMLDELIDSLHL